MDESTFESLAEETLAKLEARIEDSLDVDVELRGGILTIELDDGRQYVINKHMPNRQIWLSSPVSGAAHFDYEPASRTWRSTRGGALLHDLLARELTAATGEDIAFD
ncbi:MAG TPA: iron donor protein CyaY [Alphaproteobacteria bacterium]